MTYVIGDVHGHYKTLLALTEKLPQNAKLIFVGDLIDRGPQSMEVVKFVRESGYLCVMGNHEHIMNLRGQVIMIIYKFILVILIRLQPRRYHAQKTPYRNSRILPHH